MQLIAAKEGKSVSAVEQQWIYQSHSRTRPIPRSSQPTQTELHGLCCLFFKEREKKKNKVGCTGGEDLGRVGEWKKNMIKIYCVKTSKH